MSDVFLSPKMLGNKPGCFYVYLHSHMDDGTIFYVGKGKGRRVSAYHRRNNHWKNTAAKHGCLAEIVMEFEREACALSWEVAIIKYIGRQNLVNQTDGGEGHSGAEYSAERNAKISAAKRLLWADPEYRKRQSERLSGSGNHMFGVTGERHPNFGNTGAKSKLFGRKRPDHAARMSGDKHPNHDPTIYNFIHKSGSMEVCTKLDLRTRYNLNSSSLTRVCDGRSKSIKGWSIK